MCMASRTTILIFCSEDDLAAYQLARYALIVLPGSNKQVLEKLLAPPVFDIDRRCDRGFVRIVSSEVSVQSIHAAMGHADDVLMALGPGESDHS